LTETTRGAAHFRTLLTAAGIDGTAFINADEAQRRYGPSTINVKRRIAGAVRVTAREQVVDVVNASRASGIPLYPISTGRNWGYGAAQPAVDDCFILDLSDLKRILSVDPSSGVAVLEPGVTQGALRDYLDRAGLPFLCPVTGAGPSCSLVGNALERGYGITPHADHFLAVTSLEAVLPDGTVYRPPLAASGCTLVDQNFKWGVGPYLDGIFTQSGMGIVTEMSIVLAPRPEVVNGFFFAVKQDSQLEEVVTAIADTLREVGGVLGSINLMNARRVVSMMEPYPRDRLNAQGIMDDVCLRELAARNQVGSWMGAGAVYGNAAMAAAARKTVKQRLAGKVQRLLFFSPRSVARYHALSRFLPFAAGRSLQSVLGTLTKTLDILDGVPSTVALPLAYWQAGTPADPENLNPARDGCGLIWYSPLVPMRPDIVRRFSDMVQTVCAAHAIEPLITLTSLSHGCFDSTVPLIFDPEEDGATERAHACYHALLEAGRALGCTPYRAPTSAMDRFVDPQATYWKLAAMIKRELDPQGLIAPGRYTL
jgi:4-cresol dehydrogenase (hydroxylating)